MRILLTIHHALDSDAGAPGATLELGQALRALGEDVRFFSFDDLPRRLPEKVKAIAFPTFVARELSRRDRPRFDVIDASSGDTWLWGTLGRPAGRCTGLIARAHGLEHTASLELAREARERGGRPTLRYRAYHDRYRLWEVARSFRTADVGIFLNERDRTYAIENFGLNGRDAICMPNGIPKWLLEYPRRPYRGGPIRIAHIGSFIERKGIRYGVPALADVLRRRKSVYVSLFGTGASVEAVTAAFPRQLRTRVAVVPRYRRRQLPDLLRDHHLAVFPSLFEGHSVALLEAMACALAPVVTSIPGSREQICDGINGLLVPARDTSALSAAVVRLIDDRSLMESMRQAAHRTVQAYAWRSIALKTLPVYETAMRRARATTRDHGRLRD
jgi:glycosyltransferase involved in cell wall biosynthesis